MVDYVVAILLVIWATCWFLGKGDDGGCELPR